MQVENAVFVCACDCCEDVVHEWFRFRGHLRKIIARAGFNSLYSVVAVVVAFLLL